MEGMCIADVPTGIRIKVVLDDKETITGLVEANYGASLVLRKPNGKIVSFSNNMISFVEAVTEADSAAWQDNIQTKKKEFEKFLARIQGA